MRNCADNPAHENLSSQLDNDAGAPLRARKTVQLFFLTGRT
ncbi:hypothetical protein A33K_13252 [Burkholderia humptydooensis MSMB43]|uniref:Uncharacterized protein n=1 Tax=Burkholderia humptydooensis MSMB43 TaxID=441157 RepID=A0ABN0GBS2_9BURK|nr:hypothetical protein A33K_13252 [Burkholderia humptydooensis MSMB43]